MLQWQPPPEPLEFSPTQPDVSQGVADLQALGLLQLLLAEHEGHYVNAGS